MKQLEIKNLAPYLPYGLRIKWNKNIYEMISLRSNERCQLVDKFSDEVYGVKLLHIKTILRPISELDNLIKKEFEKYDRVKECDMEIINLFCYENTNTDEPLVDLDLNKLPYECIEYMFRNHYDFFGLVSVGLAIDINTLNK
jgi:hypothetical protein